MRIRATFDTRITSRISYLIFLREGHYCNISVDKFSFGLSLSEFYTKIGSIKTDKELGTMLNFSKKNRKNTANDN